jgi:hypothetical protein
VPGEKTPVLLTLLLTAFFVAAVIIFQPYSADWPGTAFTRPARNYLDAAIEQDSVRLVRLSASKSAVLWALHTARAHPDTLAQWGRRIRAWTGRSQGDTAQVFVYPAGDVCRDIPIEFLFVGSGNHAKVLEAKSPCFEPPRDEAAQGDQ